MLAAENVRHGVAKVATPGTPVPLVSERRTVLSVVIVALKTNTSDVAVGGISESNAVNATTQNAPMLSAGDSIPFGPCDLSDIHVDALVSNEGVAFITEE